jgi:hypothetical protein
MIKKKFILMLSFQTSQDEEETASVARSRQPRWKRTSRFRKSIAIMETDILDSNNLVKTSFELKSQD